MNKVTTINLNGNAYQLEESGYEALRAYLESAARRLEGNPDKDEIIADIERAIADKFRAFLGAYKTVVITREVEAIIVEMGPVQDATDDAGEPRAAAAGGQASAASGQAGAGSEHPSGAKRLYRIHEGAMIGGVCNGLAAYLNIDVTVIRIVFAVLAVLTWGVAALLYLGMMVLIPSANTPAEKAAASGVPSTAQEFIRRAREGYYEGMKTFTDKQARRQWKRKFKQEMRGWRRDFKQEMHENSHQWQKNWHEYWAQHPHYYGGAGFARPFLWLIRAALLLAGLGAAVSLLSTGAVFGVALPVGMPVWVGLIAVFVVYHLVAWPFKALRHAGCYHGMSGPGYGGPLVGAGDVLVWVVFLVAVVCLADRHMPQVHEALKNLPPVIHEAVDSVQRWWDKR
jgi:phage shock protein PspC (stress-responsive transcriptional regulator)